MLEPDWDAMIVDHPDRDLTARIVRVVADGIRQPTIGRRLYGLLAGAGFERISTSIVGIPSGLVWFEHSRAIRDAVAARRLDEAQLGDWMTECRAADREGRFLCRAVVVLAAGSLSHN